MKFRYDINGLRAIAVIAVVLYHFNPTLLPGGFAGVDVFFVISGFLMTGIIFRGLECNNFNLYTFYKARANRIIPPLTVMCLFLLTFTFIKLSPLDYITLGKHISSSLLFFSNMIYWRESGYFDVSSYDKWLVHTWSLSAEWQFYVLYPIILLILYKILSLKTIKRILLVGTIFGFFFGVIVTIKWPNPAYYFLPTRAWEMMLGGLAFLYPFNFRDRTLKSMGYLGILLILFSFIYISNKNPWPGHMALIPAFGAYLLIKSNQQLEILTNNTILQCIGKWSYSIYLWHWPIVVYGHYNNIENWSLLGIPLSICLGLISYYFIEKKIIEVKVIYGALFASTLFASTFLYYSPSLFYKLLNNDPVPNSVSNAIDIDIHNDQYSSYTWHKIKEFEHTSPSLKKDNVLIIGDSQAGDLTNILVEYGLDNRYNITSTIISAKCGAPYIVGESIELWENLSTDFKNGLTSKEACQTQWKKIADNRNIEKYNTIILSMNWRRNSGKLILESIKNIRKNNANAKIIVASRKSLNFNFREFIYTTYKNKVINPEKLVYQKNISNFNEIEELGNYLINADSSISYLNLIKAMCDETSKTCTYTTNEMPIFYDFVHSTKEGVTFIKEHLTEDLNALFITNKS